MKKFLPLFVLSLCLLVSGTYAQTPTIAASGITTAGSSTSTISINWVSGNGAKRLVTCALYGVGASTPINGVSYTASSTYGSGSNISSSGNYVVYNGTSTGTTIFGLSADTRYVIRIYEYNPTGYLYLSSHPTYYEYSLATQPVTQCSGLTFSSVSTNYALLTLSSFGSGSYVLHSLRASSTYANPPVDGTDYVSNLTYGSGDYITGTSPYPYVMYDGSAISIGASGLSPGVTYTAAAFSYNGTSDANNYYTSSYPTTTFTTLAAEPTSASSTIAFSAITDASMTVSWTVPSSGGGVYRIVTCKPGYVNNDLPSDATYYIPGSTYGTGSQIGGASGAYCVYNGTGNYVNVTGLSNTTSYCFSVYEYNVSTNTYNNTYNYYTGGYLSGYQQTLATEPTVPSSGLTFSSITSNSVRATWANGNGARRNIGVRAGRLQTAIAFDGTNDCVAIPATSSLNLGSQMTVEAWIKVNAFTVADQAIVTKGDSDWKLTRNGSANSLKFTFLTTSIFTYNYSVYGNRSVNDGKWHHVAATYNGSQLILYIDGTLDAYASASGSIDYNSYAVQIGGNSQTAGKNFDGQIDEVRIWSIAQSNTNIRAYMNKTLVGDEYGLKGYWKFDEGFASATTALNSSLLGSSLNGALTGFASTVSATNFTSTSGWTMSGANVNLPQDFYTYSDISSFMSTTNSSYYYGGSNTFVVYKGPDSTSLTVTGLSPNTYYDFAVVDFNGISGNNNYLADQYATADVLTSNVTIPTITTFSPASGTSGTIVTITGTGFNATAANNTVYFGGMKAVVLSANAGGTQLTVQVPVGATQNPISVTNNTLTAYSLKPFVVTSACSGAAFTTSSLNAAGTLGLSWYPSDMEIADMDLDGKPDLVAVNSAYYLSVIRNTSSGTGITFGSPYNFYNPYSSYSDLAVADFDGDGKMDAALNNGYNGTSSIVVYRNTSSPAAVGSAALVEFSAYSASGWSITDIAAGDLDKDGKPDLVVSYNNNYIAIYRNISSTGNVNFAPYAFYTVASSAVISDIALADMDGNGMIDIVAACGSLNKIDFLRNVSAVGSIGFVSSTPTALSSSVQGLAIGDIDTDGKPDVVTGYGSATIAVLKNTSVIGTISLSPAPTTVATPASVTDVNIGDIDGDGKSDIAVGYASGTQISLFKNSSTATFSIGAATNFGNYGGYSNATNVVLGDLNGDSKMDVFANTNSTVVSTFQNNINPLAAEPTIAASGLNFAGVTTTTTTVNFTPGNGANKVVFARLATAPALVPIDGVNYVPNTIFGSGTDIGGGNYCVFNGNGNTVSVTGLLSNTAYVYSVYEYNGTIVCDYNYMPNSTANTGTQTTNNTPPTLAAISNPASICQSSGLQTINLTGIGTGAVNETQTLVITASSGNTGLIPTPTVSYTSPATTGSVSYTPVAGISGTAIITVTINDGATNNNITTRTFTVTVDHTPSVSVAGTDQQICPNVATLAANTPAYGTGAWTFNYTSNGSITLTSATNPTTTVNNFTIGDSVRLLWTISNGACPSSQSFVSIHRKNCPTTADFTVNATAECLNISPTVTYTDASVASGATIVSWNWNFGAGAFPPTATGAGPHTVTYSTSGAKTVSLQVTDNLSASDIEIKTGFVTISDVPNPSGNVSGTTTVCQGQNSVSYSVPAIGGATGYTWSLPSGAALISGVNTNNITVNFGSGSISGNISVYGTNSCGSGTVSANFPVTINPLPSTAGVITGPTSVCDGATGVTYSVPAIANATSYNWTVPGGVVIMSGSTTNTIIVNFIAGSAGGSIDVVGVNSCGNGVASHATVTVNPYPSAADVISGQTLITTCPSTTGVTYSIPLTANATSYNWTVPSGASITSGTGTNAITVTYGAGAISGNVTVTPVNGCGNGTASTLGITVNTLPDMAGIISGTDTLSVCPASNGIIYTVSPVFNASYYMWSLPAGATIVSGDSTNSITVNFAANASSGIISVYGKNNCGVGATSQLAVYVSTVPTQDLCMVSVDNNSNYNTITWEKPVTMAIDSFRIYREVTSSFVHIGSVPYDSLSTYVDSIYAPAADPNTTNFRYKISAVDTCGNESVLSTHHRTIFLQANLGVGGVVNLNWVPYEGATVTYYLIMRDTTGTGAYVAIDSVPGANTVYTDLTPPTGTMNVSYLLESIWSTSCTPTRAAINTTRSNIKHVALTGTATGVVEQNIMNSTINVYPNPANEMITVEYPAGFKQYRLQLFDALGQLIYNEQLESDGSYSGVLTKQVDVSSFTKGVYFVSVQTEYGSTFKRLVIQ